jgi:X-X-X-Leu-X-X-Gly heptad repeat protein
MKRWNLAVGKSAKVLSVLLTVTMSFSVFGCGAAGKTGSAASAATATEASASAGSDSSSTAASGTSGSSSAVLQEAMEQVVPSHSSGEGKDETVYVISDSTGKADKVIVSDWLKNGKGSDTVEDKTDLSDIQNVKGYGSYTVNKDGTISWQADGSDIYYQGTTDKTLPVDVKLSYQLDGKDISPEDLAGKSGHVTIRFDYSNNQKEKVDIDGEETEISVPFAMMSGAVLPTDTFSNVEVTNGRIMSEGNNNIVVGVAFPGLKDSLDWDNLKKKAKDAEAKKKLDDMNIPDYVEISADVKDFSLDMTMTMASSNVLSDINLTDSVDTSSLTDKMNDLQEGADKLVDGTQKLKNGTSDLKKGTTDLRTGTQTLKDGTSDLAVGTNDLKTGADKLVNGASDLKNGTSDLKTGADKLANGTNTLVSGANSLSSGANTLKSGTSTLASKSKDLDSGAGSLDSGAAKLASGTSDLAAGADTLKAGVTAADPNTGKTMQQGMKDLDDGLKQLDTKLNGDGKTTGAAADTIGLFVKSVDKLNSGIETVKGGLTQVVSSINGYNVGGTHISGLAEKAEDIYANGAFSNDTADATEEAIQALKSQKTVINELQQSTSSVTETQLNSLKSAMDSAENEYYNALQSQMASNSAPVTVTQQVPVLTMQSSSEKIEDDNSTGSDEIQTDTTDAAQTTADSANETQAAVDSTETVQQDVKEESSGSQETDNTSNEETVSEDNVIADPNQSQSDDVEDSPDVSTSEELSQKKQAMVSAEEAYYEAKYSSDLATQVGTVNSQQYSDSITALEKAQATVTKYRSEAKAVSDGLTTISTILEGAIGGLDTVEKGLTVLSNSLGTLQSQISGMASGVKALAAGADLLNSKTGTLIAGISQLDNGANDLKSGASTLKSGTSTLKSGTSALVTGASDLDSGAGTLASGASDLASGASSLQGGVNDLDTGAGKLDNGAGDLLKGTNDLDSGAGDLNTGADKLDSGAGDLLEGTITLDDGVETLDSGASELLDGMLKLDNEGIKKLTELFGDNVSDVVDRINAVADAGKNYNSFTESLDVTSDNSEGQESGNNVKFIYKTDAIEAPDSKEN